MNDNMRTCGLFKRIPIVNVLLAAELPPKSSGLINIGGSLATVFMIGVAESFIDNPGTTTNS